MVTSLLFLFFLSECDVGSSKAVVNGLAPGSHGPDKGEAVEEKPGLVLESISGRCRACWVEPFPPLWERHHWPGLGLISSCLRLPFATLR